MQALTIESQSEYSFGFYMGNFAFCFCLQICFKNIHNQKSLFLNSIGVLNSLDPDQSCLGLNCLHLCYQHRLFHDFLFYLVNNFLFSTNIGITHVFSCINICRVPRKLFEHEAVRPSVQTSSESPGKC